MSYMQDIPVRNLDLLTRLNRYRDFLMDDVDEFQRIFHLSCKEHASQRHYWTGQPELDKVRNDGHDHEGFPDSMYGYELSPHRKGHEFFNRGEHESKLCYHSAKTDCWRCTVSFTFDTSELSSVFREDLLEEISSVE